MFVPKLPSLKLPPISSQVPQPVSVERPSEMSLPPLNPLGITNGAMTPVRQNEQFIVSHNPVVSHVQRPPASDNQWKAQIETRMNTFDNKLSDLVDILKTNQQFMMDSQYHSRNQNPQILYEQFPYQQQHSSIQGNIQHRNNISHNNISHNSHLHQAQISSATYSSYPASRAYSPVQPIAPQPQYQTVSYPIGTNSSNDSSNSTFSNEIPSDRRRKAEEQPTDAKRKRTNNEEIQYPVDFRDGFLSKDEANNLFAYFDANISQQLFGFEISKVSVDSIWDSCPVLVCAICTIASIHHPSLSKKSKQLQVYLQDLCQTLLFKGKPETETDGFNTIVALILCSFWLSDSQMFTGLAMQLAKEYGFNNPYSKNKDKLKLWYLLYVLDGQQSLTFNRQPLVNAQEFSLKHSREILLTEQNPLQIDNSKNGKSNILLDSEELKEKSESSNAADVRKERFTDMRLVSQVEYNQALNEAFQGNAWDLLAPSSFGIPSKSNLELDKWMVSWTVLLSPGNHGAVWSSKSTLIYYNFAKMHINSSAVRQLQVNPSDNINMLPKLNENANYPENTRRIDSQVAPADSSDEDTDDDSPSPSDEDEFISNEGIMSKDEKIVTASIAVSAAQTVLNLVINDKDILDNLKYVPVHIHIMLYYAALLLINPPLESINQSVEFKPEDYYSQLLNNIRVIKTLQKKIYNNLPIDTKFGNRLIRSLNDIVDEKLTSLKKLLVELPESNAKIELLKNHTSLIDSIDAKNIVEIFENDSTSSRGSTPGPERIAAWPGSNHGHP
ncbi:hypothetical protein G9P44_001091 [Scheffersomyces stipitis]|nr:hypothetical protein G9P44_001091 [Scheffersomyces stipitis]